jgi:hypothetical protein
MTVVEPDYELVRELMRSTVAMDRAKRAEEFSVIYTKEGTARNLTPTVYVIGVHPPFDGMSKAFQLSGRAGGLMAVVDVPEADCVSVLRLGEPAVNYKREVFWKKISTVMVSEPDFVARAFRGASSIRAYEIAKAICSDDPRAKLGREAAGKYNRSLNGNESPLLEKFDPFEL